MSKTLYLHIGTGKTGSTSLQQFFRANQEQLARLGLVYCRSGRIYDINHHLLCRNRLRRDEATQDTVTEQLAALRVELERSPAEAFLASSEYFPGLSGDEIEELRAALPGVDIVPLVYFRRQDEYLESWYAQVFKVSGGVAYSIHRQKQMLEDRGSFDFFAITERWRRVNADGRIVVRAYEPRHFTGGSIVNDFFSALGRQDVVDADLPVPEARSNPSLRPDQMRLAQTLLDRCDQRQRRILAQPFPELDDRSRYHLSAAERRALVEEYADSNRAVAATRLGRPDLFLDQAYPESSGADPFLFLQRFALTVLIHHPDRLKRLRRPFLTHLAATLADPATGDETRHAARRLARTLRDEDQTAAKAILDRLPSTVQLL